MAGESPRRDSVKTLAHTRAKALNGTGWIAIFQGDYGAAKTFLEEGLVLYREVGDEEGVASCLVDLGLAAVLGQRDDVPLPTLLDEAMGLRPNLKERRTVARLLILAGITAAGRGDLGQTIALHEESLALLRKMWDVQSLGGCLINLGFLELGRNDYTRASSLFREALPLAHELDDKTIIQFALDGLAAVAAHQEQPVRAARLWRAAEAAREAFGIRVSPLSRALADYENRLGDARARLGAVAFAEEQAKGEAMTQDEAVEYALSEEEPPVVSHEERPVVVRLATLTRREQEVAALVSRGLTNRRIAKELVLSERTVSTHVSRILKKLNLGSREQVARVVEQWPPEENQTAQ